MRPEGAPADRRQRAKRLRPRFGEGRSDLPPFYDGSVDGGHGPACSFSYGSGNFSSRRESYVAL